MPTPCRLAVQLLCFCLIAATPMLAKATDEDLKADARRDRNDTKRAVNAADHRIEEAGCTADKVECARRKKTDQMEEAKEHASDQIHEAAERVQDTKAQDAKAQEAKADAKADAKAQDARK